MTPALNSPDVNKAVVRACAVLASMWLVAAAFRPLSFGLLSRVLGSFLVVLLLRRMITRRIGPLLAVERLVRYTRAVTYLVTDLLEDLPDTIRERWPNAVTRTLDRR